MLFAEEQQKRGRIKSPAVLGAFIDLGHCLDLIDSYYLEDLKETYHKLKSAFELLGKPLPVNKATNMTDDLIIRRLDCAVIQAHVTDSSIKYDSVKRKITFKSACAVSIA